MLFSLLSLSPHFISLYFTAVITFCVSSLCWWNLSKWYEEVLDCRRLSSSPSLVFLSLPFTLLSLGFIFSFILGSLVLKCFFLFGSWADSICRPVCCFIFIFTPIYIQSFRFSAKSNLNHVSIKYLYMNYFITLNQVWQDAVVLLQVSHLILIKLWSRGASSSSSSSQFGSVLVYLRVFRPGLIVHYH